MMKRTALGLALRAIGRGWRVCMLQFTKSGEWPPGEPVGENAAAARLAPELELITTGQIVSAHDCAEGGIGVALAESSFPAGVGARINLSSNGAGVLSTLCGETASRVVISCDRERTNHIKKVAETFGLQAEPIGQTIKHNLEISVDGSVRVSAPVSELKQVWGSALQSALHVETREHLVPEVLQKS